MLEFYKSETGIVRDAFVFGCTDAFRVSGYPMSVDTESAIISPKRCDKLANTPIGEGHDNFLCGITVHFDLTFTVKAWTEAERYHFFQIVSSQSTMHRITQFNLDKCYIHFVDDRIIDIMKEKVADYNSNPTKGKYLEILYSNPCGCKLTARMTTNYRQLKTIYHQRKDHRLPEWLEFCRWIETLPMSEWITGESNE